MKQRTYIAIDLKSFYASVECRERGLDPLDTNLVVADESRTDKTICLAVTPSLKSYGISGRGRLFEVKQRVKEANAGRQHDAPGHRLDGTSHFFSELQADPSLAIDFIIAPPRMAYYMEYSTRIYQVYLKYIAPEDIVVYSIDEVFMDVTDYLNTYKLSAHDLAMKIILDVLETTGITATAGIGTNLFLCKVAMDIVAKHIPADKNGVRIAELDEMKFRRELWSHQPLTDFWRVGRGIAKKLEQNGMFTMGDVALCSERNEDLLYKLFGKNAELLIDHLNDEMVALLKSGRINNRLLCELATHKDFIKFLADIEIYVDGIATMQIQNLNALVDTVRHEIIERYRPGEDDPHLKVLQAAHISDDEYFSHMVLDDLNLIIRDIREAHKKDSESAPQTTVADELKENLEAVENFKGSRDEKLVILYCKQLGINYKNLSEEEFRWLIRILKKSKKMGTPISQRKKR